MNLKVKNQKYLQGRFKAINTKLVNQLFMKETGADKNMRPENEAFSGQEKEGYSKTYEEISRKIADPFQVCREAGYIENRPSDQLDKAKRAVLEVASEEVEDKTDILELKEVSVEISNRLFEKRLRELGLEGVFDPEKEPQKTINELLDEENRFLYNKDGETVSLIGYLEDHYERCGLENLSISAEYIDSSEITGNSEFSYLLERDAYNCRQYLEHFQEEEIEIPIITVRKDDRSARIPVIKKPYSDEEGLIIGNYHYTEIDCGLHLYRSIRLQTPQQTDRINKEKGLVYYMSSIAHEIDHVVFNLIPQTESKSLGYQVEDLYDKNDRLKEKLEKAASREREVLRQKVKANLDQIELIRQRSEYYKDPAARIKTNIVFEGLAELVGESLVEDQLDHLAYDYSGKESAQQTRQALELAVLTRRGAAFISTDNPLYSIGQTITASIKEQAPEHFGRLYDSGLFESVINDEEILFNALIGLGEFALKEEAGENPEEAIETIKEGLENKLGDIFILDSEKMKQDRKESEKEVEKLSKQKAAKQLEELLKKNSKLLSRSEPPEEFGVKEELAYYLTYIRALQGRDQYFQKVVEEVKNRLKSES